MHQRLGQGYGQCGPAVLIKSGCEPGNATSLQAKSPSCFRFGVLACAMNFS